MSSSVLTIDFATAADLEEWLPLWKAYQVFYKTSLSDEVTKNTWDRFLDPNVPMYCLIARMKTTTTTTTPQPQPQGEDSNSNASKSSNSKIVGLAHFVFHLSTWSTMDYCYLEDLYVDPSCRGQQVGKRLITRLYWEAMGFRDLEGNSDESRSGLAPSEHSPHLLPSCASSSSSSSVAYPPRMREAKAARVYWHTQESNATAQRLYNWVAKKTEFIQYCRPLCSE